MHERVDSADGRPIHCRVCTILIGDGFEERVPIPLPEDQGYVCLQCNQSLRRQAERRSAEQATEAEVARQ